ncbi:MAG: DUF1326 domain-containing protein [Actinomycetota bacterium]
MADKIPWHIKGDYIEACSCDYGCPCNFNGFPTKGVCEAVVAFKIEKGSHGTTTLDGIAVLEAVMWPKAIHEGNGRAAVFIDESASEEQRGAIVRILTGQDGGMPFELLAETVTEVKGPFFVPVSFDSKGTKTKASVKGVETELTPHTNPVTGEEHEVHTVLPGGFIWTDGNAAKAAKNVAHVDGIDFDWTGQNAYFAKVAWSNEEMIESKTKFAG